VPFKNDPVLIVFESLLSLFQVLSKLGVYKDENKFENPARPEAVVYISPDVPHGLKNFRNHTFDYGFRVWMDGKYKYLCKEKYEWLLSKDGKVTGIRMLYKISEADLNLKGQSRQRVKPAVRVLSRSVAKAFGYFGETDQEDIVQIINDGFDVLNSANPRHPAAKLKSGLGMFEDEQIEALEKFQDLLLKIEWREKNGCYTTTKKPFQKGLLCSIRSTIELFHEMKDEGVKYILTKRFNQDPVENTFSSLRRITPGQHPNLSEAIDRLRILMLKKNVKDLVNNNKASYEYADDEDGEHDDDGDYEPRIIPAKPANMPPLMVQEHVPDQEQNPFVGDSQEGIEYVSGFYTKRLSYEGAEPTKDSWTDRVDYGKLKHGKRELIKLVNLCSKYFNVLHKEGLKSGPNMIGIFVINIYNNSRIKLFGTLDPNSSKGVLNQTKYTYS